VHPYRIQVIVAVAVLAQDNICGPNNVRRVVRVGVRVSLPSSCAMLRCGTGPVGLITIGSTGDDALAFGEGMLPGSLFIEVSTR